MNDEVAKDWRLREAGPDDADALSLVGAATFLETFAGTLDGSAIAAHCRTAHSPSYYANARSNGARAWLAEAATGGAPIGFALAGLPDLPGMDRGDIELKRIYALSRWHGTGVGAALLRAVLAAYRDRPRLILGVFHDNRRAIGFYRKHGFAEVATRQFDVGGTLYDDVVLARRNPDFAGTPA